MKLACLLLVFCCVTVTATNMTAADVASATSSSTYNQDAAELYVKYCGASYCCGTLGQGCALWNCDVCKKLPSLLTTPFFDKPTNANGFVGYSKQDNLIIVVFAGTDPLSIKNWVDDIDTFFSNYAGCSGCKVHEGFYKTYKAVQKDVLNAVRDYKEGHPDAQLAVTGHSLGASLAVHAALDIKLTLGYTALPLYVFGLPRVGNPAFADFWKATMPVSFHVGHNRDPVPHLPMKSWGFQHIPTEVFYNEDQSSYQICDGSGEDPTCSDKLWLALDITDHLNYLSFSFLDNFMTCKL